MIPERFNWRFLVLVGFVFVVSGCAQMITASIHKVQNSLSDTSYVMSDPELTVYSSRNATAADNLQWKEGRLHVRNGIYFDWDNRFVEDEVVTEPNPHPCEGSIQFMLMRKNRRPEGIPRSYRDPLAYSKGILVIPRKDGKLEVYKAGQAYFTEAVNNTVRNGLGAIGLAVAWATSPLTRRAPSTKDLKVFAYSEGYYRQTTLKTPHGEIRAMDMDEDGNLAVRFENGVYAIYKWDGEKLVHRASFVLYSKDDWIMWTPQRFFDQGVLTEMNSYPYYELGGEGRISFSQLSEAYHRPDLVTKELKKSGSVSGDAAGVVIKESLRLPPPRVNVRKVAGKSHERAFSSTVEIEVQDTGGGIGDIRVFHNGKIAWSRGVYRVAGADSGEGLSAGLSSQKLTTVDSLPLESNEFRSIQIVSRNEQKASRFFPAPVAIGEENPLIRLRVTLPLLNGENIVTVEALNRLNTVRSVQQSVRIKSSIPKRKSRMFLLCVGIDRFLAPSVNLSFAAKDASDFASGLRPGYDWEKLVVYLLRNEEADKGTILAALEAIAMRCRPGDRFVLYFATHGLITGDTYYLLTHDFDGELSTGGSINASELMEMIKIVPALEQVIILDTCHAGGLGTLTEGLFDSRTMTLARTMGIHLFAASHLKEEAADGYKGNGLYTHFMLKGLNGAADADKDGTITPSEQGDYVERSVLEVSGGRQKPYVRHYGKWAKPLVGKGPTRVEYGVVSEGSDQPLVSPYQVVVLQGKKVDKPLVRHEKSAPKKVRSKAVSEKAKMRVRRGKRCR